MAIRMLQDGVEIPLIARYVDLTVKQVKQVEAIKKEIDRKASWCKVLHQN